MYRLYTGPKGWDFYITLSSTQAYEKIMKNNVELESSFNSWKITISKTLNTTKSAVFSDSGFLDWGRSFSNHGEDLSCLVRLKRMIKC